MKNDRHGKKRYVILPIAALIAVAGALIVLLCVLRGCANGKPVSVYTDRDGYRIALYGNGETRILGTASPVTTRTSVTEPFSTKPVSDLSTTVRELKTYTVTFLDYSGVVLGQSVVEKGGAAIPPPDPVREGYVFTGWSGQIFNVTSSKTVTAKYTQIDVPNVFDLSYSVSGGRLTVNLKIDGKVSIAGAQGVLTLPDGIVPSGIVCGSGVYFRSEGQDVFFVFASLSGKNQTSDKELLSLSFDGIADLPEEINFDLNVSDAFDQNFESVSFSVIGQRVFLEK